LLDALVENLQRSVNSDVLWNQKLYVKIYGMSKRELRVYPAVKKGRIDLLFMRATAAEVEELLRRHGAKDTVNASYVYDDGTPWMGISQTEQVGGPVLSALNAWLMEFPERSVKDQVWSAIQKWRHIAGGLVLPQYPNNEPTTVPMKKSNASPLTIRA